MQLTEEWSGGFGGGMNDSATAVAMGQNEVALALNARIATDSALSTRSGTKRLHAAALDGVGYGISPFTTAAGTAYWFAFSGTKAYASDDEAATWADVADTLDAAYWSIVQYRTGAGTNLILAANGGTNAYQWDGSTWGAIAGWPAGVKYLAVANDRVWYAGHAGNTVVGCAVGDHTVITGNFALTVQVQTHDGDSTIMGLCQVGTVLLALKAESTAWIDGYGNSDLVVLAGARGASRSVGCVAPRTIQPIGEQSVAWLSKRGIAVYEGGQIRIASDKLQTFVSRGISWSTLSDTPGVACAVYQPNTHEYRVDVPVAAAVNTYTMVLNTLTGGMTLDTRQASTGGTIYLDDDGYEVYVATPDRRPVRTVAGYEVLADPSEYGMFLKLDTDGYELQDTAEHEVSAIMVADRSAEERTSVPIAIGYDGFVRALDFGTHDDVLSDGTGGTDIKARIVSRPFLANQPFRRKRVRKARVLVGASATAAMQVGIRSDGVLGTQTSVAVPASSENLPGRVKLGVTGRGYAMQVDIATSDPLKISGIAMSGYVMDEGG